jgi:predicted PurR-regulated permease PerM
VANEPVTPRTVFRWTLAAALALLLVYVAAAGLWLVRDIIVEVLVALFIAVSLDPAVRFLTKRGMPRSWAVTVIFGVTFLAFVGMMAAIGPPLVRQGISLSNNLPDRIDDFVERFRSLREFGDKYGVTDQLREAAKTLPGRIGDSVLDFVQRFLGALFTGLLITVLTIYFMADLPRLRDGVVRLVPRRHRRHARNVVDVMVDKVGAYMIGNIIISLIAGLASFIVLQVLGVPYAVPLAVAVAITDLIPMIGATLGAVICVLVTAFTTRVWPETVVVIIFFVVYQQLENYLIAPRVMRNSVDLPAVAVLIAALIGGKMLGLIGALMAIPIAAAVRVLTSPMIEPLDDEELPDEAAEPSGGADTLTT